MSSLWRETSKSEPRERLQGEIKTDTAVIGAGLCGILTAYELTRRGIDCVVLEADRIGSGVTGDTTAKITAQHGLIYGRLISQFGKEQAAQYAAANSLAIGRYRRIIESNSIDCDFSEQPNYVYTLEDTEKIENEVKAAKDLEIDAEYVAETTLPFPVKAAVRFNNQASFHPLKFLYSLAENLTVYENTRVVNVEDHTVTTDSGSVEAQKVVFACHYPFINVPGYYFLRMHQQRSYVIALEGADLVDGMYRDENSDGLSLRNYNNFLIFSKGDHRTGKNEKGGFYRTLEEKAAELYPGCRVAYRWSAQDAQSEDMVPYIGKYSATTPDWFVATGFNKWGMTTSMVSSVILSDMIEGRFSPYSEVFSPQRFKPAAGAMKFAQDVKEAAVNLFKQGFTLPDAKLNDVQPNEARIVEHEEAKVGVYKDPGGNVHMINTRCSHLGCQLAWNADDLAWECPCHGSRFDIEGKVLNGPAIKDVSITEN
ncbi:MAG: Cytochrome b6-f complex iron-sulfur subunit 1 [Firmicutes bacterium ADurb.Bin182]|nr:MAG: Cytochrome b6-f complex iron-sulfur subunit 1 [Firmicutes bacterium ADurb.Bin182]